MDLFSRCYEPQLEMSFVGELRSPDSQFTFHTQTVVTTEPYVAEPEVRSDRMGEGRQYNSLCM